MSPALSAASRAFAIVGGVLLVTTAVPIGGIDRAVRRRTRRGNPLPFDAATLGAAVLLGVLAVLFVFSLSQR